MTKTILPVSFFFGANKTEKYCSLYPEMYNPYEKGNHLILKGGPGTGKSTIMKKIAKKLEEEGCLVERGYCSADPNSLDVVMAEEKGFSIVDGTAPHTFDPTTPGVNESIVDLSIAWDKNYLKRHSEPICELIKENKRLHRRAAEYLDVARQMDNATSLLCASFLNREKLERYAFRLAEREIPPTKGRERGKERRRFLSAISPDGVFVQHDTVVALAERIITIEDEYSVASSFVSEYVSEYALNMGYDVYKCYCPLFPLSKAEHIIIPELKLCLFTQNSFHFSLDDREKLVHATRFFDKEQMQKNKEKIRFYKKVKKEFTDEAVKKLSLALDVHNRLEDFYIKATDFSVVDEVTERLLQSI